MLYSFDTQLKDTQFKVSASQPQAAVTDKRACPAGDERTDEQLMQAIAGQRDETALATLYKRHAALLHSIVGKVINNDADTEDLLQEIFCEVWNLADRFSEDKGHALGWIVTLSRRRAIDRLRKKMTYQRAGERLRDEHEREGEQMYHSADEDAVASDRAELLQRVMQTLPEAQREALMYAYYRGMSQREISKHTGIPLGTIKTRLELAVRKVKTAVLAMGGEAEWSSKAA